MNALWKLSKRNFTLFFRDRSSILFSLLSSAILLIVFLVFLNKAYSNPELEKLLPGFSVIFQQWLMAGTLYTTTFSSALNAMGQYPNDQALKISSDLMVTPIKRGTVVASYILGSTLTTFAMSSIIFVLTLINVFLRAGNLPALSDIALVLLAIAVSSVFHTAFAFFLATFTKTARSYGSLGLVFHSISGFLAAIYIPIGDLSETVQKVFGFSPFFHAASLLRKAYTFSSFGRLSGDQYLPVVKDVKLALGINFSAAGVNVQTWQSVVYLLICSLIFFALSVARISKSRERL